MKRRRRRTPPWELYLKAGLPALRALLGVLWLLPYPLSPYAFHYLTLEDAFPIETCNFIEANQLSGNVFSYYNWGGYLHLRTGGRMKVYIDGRADTVYDKVVILHRARSVFYD